MYNYDNLSKYKVFLCVAECGSISQSAEQLYISQPAVSMTIKKLEESLGTTLFLRKPRGVVLTENGRLLYDGVKQALNMLSDTESNLKHLENNGRLRIAASNVLCKYLLMPYLVHHLQMHIKCLKSVKSTLRLWQSPTTSAVLNIIRSVKYRTHSSVLRHT